MNPLQPAVVPESEAQIILTDMRKKWLQGHREVRKQYPRLEDIEPAVRAVYESSKNVWLNERYQVHMRDLGPMWHLSIKRVDRGPCHDWRDFQQIKNQLVGPECEGVEIYPAESRLVDSANQYHLWVFKDTAYRIPFGFESRMVSSDPIGKSVNRPR